MDRKIPREICFHKDGSDSGEDNDDRPNSIFHPTAGAANDRERPVDPEPIGDTETSADGIAATPPMIYDTGDHISNEDIIRRVGDMDIAGDGNPEGRDLPDRGDIFYVPLAAYYYAGGDGPTVPEPEKNWHVKQRVTSTK